VAKVIYSGDALQDFERIVEFLIASSPDSAAAAVGRIRQAIEILSDHPVLGRRVAA
jgi:plasmid stabilization system protein ParE